MENEYYDLHKQCERMPPKLDKYDSWGKQVDRVVTCDAWKKFKTISSEHGIVAIPYERRYKEYRWRSDHRLSHLILTSH